MWILLTQGGWWVQNLGKPADPILEGSLISEKCVTSTGLHKTGIRGIQDTRQIIDCKTSGMENNIKMAPGGQ